MLKFRCIYPKIKKENHPENKYKYLDGELFMQQYAPVHSTELRLLTERDKTYFKEKEYDIYDIESTCFFFNTIIRQQYYYKHSYDCISHHYDSMAEIYIWKDYLRQHKIKATTNIICDLIDLLSKCIMKPNYDLIKEKFDILIK
jgi:hypothetical protein